MDAKRDWLRMALMLLAAEKVAQHAFVTAAFYSDWGGIRGTVAVSPRLLMVLGGLVAIAFAVGVWALASRRPWAADLLMGLSIFDLVGEYVAQGTLSIVCTVSFLIAGCLFILSLIYRQRLKAKAGQPGG